MLAKRVSCAAIAALLVACTDGLPTDPAPEVAFGVTEAAAVGAHFTGDVDIVWPGGKGSGAPADEDRIAGASIAAFPGTAGTEKTPGDFTYRVVSADGTPHREIGVELTWVGLEDQSLYPGEIRFLGVVVSDTKPCGGSGHSEGGGCSHDDEGGGCTHDDEGGGCSHDDEGGGCTHDDEGGGCSHDDGGGGEPGGGEPGGGGHVSGSDCRIGQVVVGWALDGGTPAVEGDRISWKWLAPDAPKVTQILAAIESGAPIPWPCKLCEKQILGGNLKLHLRGP